MKNSIAAVKKGNEGGEPRIQYAALPWRTAEPNELEILLVSSRDTRRWIIPKGWPMKGRRPHLAAAVEALEEAGLLGKIEKKTLGSYHYHKRLVNGAKLLCRVDVFAMKVLRQKKSWREKGQRVTQWVAPAKAAQLVKEPELARLITAFAAGFAGTA